MASRGHRERVRRCSRATDRRYVSRRRGGARGARRERREDVWAKFWWKPGQPLEVRATQTER